VDVVVPTLEHSKISDCYIHPVSLIRALEIEESVRMDNWFRSLLYKIVPLLDLLNAVDARYILMLASHCQHCNRGSVV
jgi:hypothetical protein